MKIVGVDISSKPDQTIESTAKGKVVNYGATFCDEGLKCNSCGEINNYKVIGFCDGINMYGKVLKCCNCGNEVKQTVEFSVESRNIRIPGLMV